MSELLPDEEIQQALQGLAGWSAVDGALRRTVTFDGYKGAVAFAVHVAMEAESANHHPDMLLAWGKVEITLTTHSAGGITAQDVDMAQRIDELAR